MNVQYKIERKYSKGFGPSVVLYEMIKSNGKLIQKKITDKSTSVKRRLKEILHIDDNQALETILVQQGKVTSLAVATPSTLRKQIEDIYSIEIFNKIDKYLLGKYKQYKMKLQDINSKFLPPEEIEKDITRIKKGLEDNKKELENSKKRLEELQTIQKEYPTYEQMNEIKLKKNNVEVERRIYERDKKRIKQLFQEYNIEDISQVKELIQKYDKEIEEINSEIEALQSTIEMLAGKLETAKTNNEQLNDKLDKFSLIEKTGDKQYRCPVCGSELTEEHAQKIIKEYKEEIKENKELIIKYNKKIKTARDKKRSAQQRQRDLERKKAKLQDRIKNYEDLELQKNKIEQKEKELEQALMTFNVHTIEEILKKYDVKTIDELIKKIQEIDYEIRRTLDDIKRIKRDIDEESQLLEEKKEKLRNSKKMKKEKEELERIIEHIEYIRNYIIKPFITNYVFERKLLKLISKRASDYIKMFSAGQYVNVNISATEDKKGLQIEVYDERDKRKKTIDELSFGDKISLGLALRLGISKTMNRIRPMKNSTQKQPRIRCVLLDEPLGELDEKRRNAVIETLLNDSSFQQIFLITHTDTGKFDNLNTIKIDKKDDASVAELIRAKAEFT